MPNTKYTIPCPLTGRPAYEGTEDQVREYESLVGASRIAFEGSGGGSVPQEISDAPVTGGIKPDLKMI